MFYILATTMYVKVKSFERKYITLLFFPLKLIIQLQVLFISCNTCYEQNKKQKQKRKEEEIFYSFVTFWPQKKACISSTTLKPHRIILKTCMERVYFVQMRRSSMPAQFHTDVYQPSMFISISPCQVTLTASVGIYLAMTGLSLQRSACKEYNQHLSFFPALFKSSLAFQF